MSHSICDRTRHADSAHVETDSLVVVIDCVANCSLFVIFII